MRDETIKLCVKMMQRRMIKDMAIEPYKTVVHFAKDYYTSVGVIVDLLGLITVTPEVYACLETLPLSSAYALSKLPFDQQNAHLQAAKTFPSSTFVAQVKAILKERGRVE